MWKSVVHAVAGPLAHAWARATVRNDGELATPVGVSISHGSGPDPDRILIFGSQVVQGVGITSYELSFAGFLARKLAARTGCGADVEVRGIDRFDAVNAADAIRSENLARFDLVLIMGGVTEILSLLPLSTYDRNVRRLLDAIAENAPPTLPVLIAGVAPFMQDMDVPAFTVGWMRRRIDRQNEVTRVACEETGAAQYVPFAPERAGVRLGRDSSAVYESWAFALEPFVERALASSSIQHQVPLDEVARQRALDDLHVLDTAPDATVDRIVEMAREMLGADVALLNFIDRDRQWTKASAGADPGELPRDEAVCNTTIQSSGAYVVEDLDADPTYRNASWKQGESHVRFYAGYPLEAPGGERVGSLCVLGREPRDFTASDKATLRDMALRAQAVLWERAG